MNHKRRREDNVPKKQSLFLGCVLTATAVILAAFFLWMVLQ